MPVHGRGELLIGGIGLARGYLGRADLTAEHFIPDPFSGHPGGRLYRTGDRAAFRPDGLIDFHGRIDFQVKLRGFRIEPGEIEAQLGAVPGIMETAVLARKDDGTADRLVAYLTIDPESELSRRSGGEQAFADERLTTELRKRLGNRLPEYMVPSAFVLLPNMPLLSTGKVNRNALASEARYRFDRPAAAYEAPRNTSEQALADIWAELLNVEKVGIHDNFFELGGDSMSAIRFIGRAGAAGLALTARQLFENPTVAQLATVLTHADTEAIPALPRDELPCALPLSFGQLRLWFLQQLDEAGSLYNMPSAVRIHGALQVDRFEEALSLLTGRQEVLRTTVALVDDKPVAMLHAPGPVSLPLDDLRGLDEAARETRVREMHLRDSLRPFDLAEALWRARLLRTGEQEYVLFFTMHHMISDGWSMPLFIQELATFYRALTEGGQAALPDLPIQYADFAAWQREGPGAALIAWPIG
jgi:aryl carrier-like protein